MCAAEFHQWLHEYCLLKRQLSQIIVQRCQIAAPKWPNDFSSAADNAVFKNRAQYIECSFVAPCCWNQILPISSSSIFVNENSFNMARLRSLLTLTASPSSFSKKNYPIIPLDQNPHQRLTRFGCVGFSMYACGFFCAPNATILLVYILAKIKMSFIWKDDFFWQNRYLLLVDHRPTFQRCSSVFVVRRKDKINYLSNQTWAKCYHSGNKH